MKRFDQNKCEGCGGRMVQRAYKHHEKVGQYAVTDSTGVVRVCEDCDDVPLTLEVLASYQRRAAALVLREAKAIDGRVIKYARKALGLKQTELAEEIGCAAETLSRYETDSKDLPKAERLAIVAILDGVEQAGSFDAYRDQKSARTSKTFEVPPLRRACG